VHVEQNFSHGIYEQLLIDFLLILQTYIAWANITHHIITMPKVDDMSHVHIQEVQQTIGFFIHKFQATIAALTLCTVLQDIIDAQRQQVYAHEVL
jgi:hypothetical protein